MNFELLTTTKKDTNIRFLSLFETPKKYSLPLKTMMNKWIESLCLFVKLLEERKFFIWMWQCDKKKREELTFKL